MIRLRQETTTFPFEVRTFLSSILFMRMTYSEIPLLRPPKNKTFYLLKTLFAKLKLFFYSFSRPSVPRIRDQL